MKEFIRRLKLKNLVNATLNQLEKRFEVEEEFCVINRGPKRAFEMKRNGTFYYFTAVVDAFEEVGILITKEKNVIESLLQQREIRGEYHGFLISSKRSIPEKMSEMEGWITEKALRSLFKS